MLFFKKQKFEKVVKSVVQQQIDNAELIEDLLMQQMELTNSTINIDEICDIVASQQKAIRKLQGEILALQKLANQNGEA